MAFNIANDGARSQTRLRRPDEGITGPDSGITEALKCIGEFGDTKLQP